MTKVDMKIKNTPLNWKDPKYTNSPVETRNRRGGESL